MTQHNPIPPFIREITELNLTRWGQIKLCAFPEAAIVDARKGLRLSKNAKDPFALFFKIALDYCTQNGIEPHFKAVDLMKEAYKMPADARMTLPGTKGNGPRSLTELASAIQHRPGDTREEDYAAAQKIYRHYTSSEWGTKFARSNGIENPWWNRLQKEDQERIMSDINNEEKNEKNCTPTDTPFATITDTSDRQPVCHGP